MIAASSCGYKHIIKKFNKDQERCMARKYPFQKEAVSPHGAVNYFCNFIVGHTCATLGSSKDDLYL